MDPPRIQALVEELRETIKAFNREKEAHSATFQEVINLRKHLKESDRKRKVLEGDVELLVLKCKLLEGDGEDKDGGSSDGDMTAVHTDDKTLKSDLPDAPIHHPGMYKAFSASNSEGLNASSSANYLDHTTHALSEDNVAGSTHGTKRSFDEANSEDTTRVIVCIHCYSLKLRCDSGEPCNNCATFKRLCKRAKCKDYETGECKRASCLRAHREDEEVYDNIVRTGHIARVDPSKPAKPKPKRRRAFRCKKNDDDKKGGSGDSDGGGGGSTSTRVPLHY
ncbi:hypothetical protein J4E81_001563 [Alternaria sp. BMP 2799]|nr:hypothetical protein J4E81_001563 [Alternaria sp. BMP 2799]